MNATLKGVLSEKLRLFCVYCTIHGAYYLPKGRFACVAWGAIMIAGLVLWGALSHMLWHKYSTDPTVTVVESTYYQSDVIPFPAVMICDPNPVYGAKTKNVSHILRSKGYNNSEITEFYDSFLEIHNRSYVPPEYILNMHSFLHDIGLNLETLAGMLKKPCNVTIVSCYWRSKKYKCSEMFYEVATVVGHCCHFDIAYFQKFAPHDTTFKPGFTAAEGLEVTVNGVKSYSNGTVTTGPVLLYMHDTAHKITRMDTPLPMLDSCYYDVDIDLYAIDSSPEVKALSLKSRKCSIESDKGIGGISYEMCIATLLMIKIVNYCKCIPFMYSAEELSVEKFPSCKFEQYLCIYQRTDIYLADMQSVIDMDECYQRCDYAQYDPTAEFIRRVRASSNNSLTKVAIAYAASTCLKYRREVIYTWDQMLANLGGIFGLCLGGSIISIFEIIWFLIDLLVTTYNFKRNKPTENIFVIEKQVSRKNSKNKDAKNKFMN